MKNGLNRVTLMGNITRDLELRYTLNKNAFVQITVACNYSRRTEVAYETAADFIPCVAWGKLAETIAKYFRKGMPIYLEGKIKNRSYENRNGEKRYITEVLIDLIRFIGEPRKDVEPQTDPGDEVSISPEDQSYEELSEAEIMPF
jgi:single-strand DNA-binding protein